MNGKAFLQSPEVGMRKQTPVRFPIEVMKNHQILANPKALQNWVISKHPCKNAEGTDTSKYYLNSMQMYNS